MPRPASALPRGFDPLAAFTAALRQGPPWDSISTFAEHKSFCGKKLYPRQRTLLRLIYLETEQMTDFDLEVIEQWREGFKDRASPCGVQPDIWERVDYLRSHGYHHFPHVQMVMGRRASKGIIGGVLGAERLAYMYSLDDWQAHYGLDPGTDGELNVVATSLTQAARRQFADIRRTVLGCKYLRPHIVTARYSEIAIRTPADERRIAALKAFALSSTSTAGRGGSAFCNYFDEMAHMLDTGSQKSGDEIYEAAQPSLDQFGKDSLTYAPSSPWCMEPSTRVLTEDLRWVAVGSLQVGDRLIGFDEHNPGGKGKGRCWRRTEVTETSIIHAPRYELSTAGGKRIVCTGEHLWLTKRVAGIGRGKGRGQRSQSYPQSWCWIKTSDLLPGDRIKTLGVDPWETENSYEAGYLAGFLDGEGHLCGGVGKSSGLNSLGYAQIFGPVQEDVTALLKERGFSVTTSVGHSDRGDRAVCHSRICGGTAEYLRLLGTIRPSRLLQKLPEKFYGGRIYGSWSPSADEVVSVRVVDEGPVVALGTSTHTLIAEGLLTHNTMSGKFYELFRAGCVMMPDYHGDSGDLPALVSDDEDPVEADPEMLVVQMPSWALYLGHSQSPSIAVRRPEFTKPGMALYGPRIARPVQYPPDGDAPENRRMARLEQRNPEKFSVERRGKFAAVIDAYLDPAKVDAMFEPPPWRQAPLVMQQRGLLTRTYRMHGDPSVSNANFGFCIAHTEDAPPDEYGVVWPCVIVDWLHVWKPEDYPDHTIDYIAVQREIAEVLTRFPTTTKLTFDQFQSQGLLQVLRRKFSPRTRITEETYTAKSNMERAEKFKSALNLGWIKSPRDTLYEDSGSLLEMELKFLSVKSGKLVKQDFGPVVTKDLGDATMSVCVDLLHDALERHSSWLSARGSYGSTDMVGLRRGHELARVTLAQQRPGGHEMRNARQALASQSVERTLRRSRRVGTPAARGGRWR